MIKQNKEHGCHGDHYLGFVFANLCSAMGWTTHGSTLLIFYVMDAQSIEISYSEEDEYANVSLVHSLRC